MAPLRPIASLAWPVSVALVYALGHVLGNGVPELPPLSAENWLLVAILPATLLITVIGIVSFSPRWVVTALWLLVAAGGPIVLLRPLVPHTLSASRATMWAAILGSAAMAYVWASRALLFRVAGPSVSFAVSGVMVATGVCLIMAGSATIAPGVIGAALAMATGSALFAIRRQPMRAAGHGAIEISLTLLIGLWTFGRFYIDLGGLELALLVFALPAAWFAEILTIRRFKAWHIVSVRMAIVACMVVTAILVSTLKFVECMNEESW